MALAGSSKRHIACLHLARWQREHGGGGSRGSRGGGDQWQWQQQRQQWRGERTQCRGSDEDDYTYKDSLRRRGLPHRIGHVAFVSVTASLPYSSVTERKKAMYVQYRARLKGRWSPGKARQKWRVTAGTKFAKPGHRPFAEPCRKESGRKAVSSYLSVIMLSCPIIPMIPAAPQMARVGTGGQNCVCNSYVLQSDCRRPAGRPIWVMHHQRPDVPPGGNNESMRTLFPPWHLHGRVVVASGLKSHYHDAKRRAKNPISGYLSQSVSNTQYRVFE